MPRPGNSKGMLGGTEVGQAEGATLILGYVYYCCTNITWVWWYTNFATIAVVFPSLFLQHAA